MIEQMTARRDFITICTPCRYFPFRHGPPEVNKQGLSGRSFRRTSGGHDRRIQTGSSGHIVSGSCHHVKVILATGKAETLAVSSRIPKSPSPERAFPNFCKSQNHFGHASANDRPTYHLTERSMEMDSLVSVGDCRNSLRAVPAEVQSQHTDSLR